MSTRFFTNHGAQTLFAKFQGVFASNKDLAAFDALVGYLRSSGWFAVRPLLENVPEIRILVGINVDSLIADYQKRGLLFHGAEGETLAQIKASLLKDIKEVAAKTYLATEISPYQLYFKLLIEYFVRAIDYDPNATEDLPKGFKRLSYQVDAVTQGVRLLQKRNGFFLADVVGLGKTIIVMLIARKFFFQNGSPDHPSHTLIVVPPALLEQESSHQTTSNPHPSEPLNTAA